MGWWHSYPKWRVGQKMQNPPGRYQHHAGRVKSHVCVVALAIIARASLVDNYRAEPVQVPRRWSNINSGFVQK